MTLAANALENLKVLEVFPQTQTPQHFAEFGDKLPQKLKSGINFFLLHVEPEPAPTPEPEEPAEPPKKRRTTKKKISDELCDTVTGLPESPAEVPEKKPLKRKISPVGEVGYKLYLKASQDGVLGKKGELIEAQKIPAGAIIHLVKRKKYVKTVIYYEGVWSDLK